MMLQRMRTGVEESRAARLRGCLFVALFVLAGCSGPSGPPRAEVDGVVMVNGRPLESGQISFVSTAANGGPSSGAEIKTGRFQIPKDKGPFPGEYQVQIRAFKGTGKKVWDGMGDPSLPGFEKNMVEEKVQYIPVEYNNVSKLKAQLAAKGANTLEFKLDVPE